MLNKFFFVYKNYTVSKKQLKTDKSQKYLHHNLENCELCD